MNRDEMRVLRGVVYMLKRIGPRTEPCARHFEHTSFETDSTARGARRVSCTARVRIETCSILYFRHTARYDMRPIEIVVGVTRF